MFVKIKYLAELYGFGIQTIKTIVERGEFEKFRVGGNGGILIEWTPKSKQLLEKFLKPKLARRGDYDNTSGESL